MKTEIILAIILLLCSTSQSGFPQTLPIPRPQRPSAQRSGQPAFMQKLKSYDETPFAAKAVLKNGLTIIVHEFHAFPVVSITSYVRAGIAFENNQSAGISETMERLFFRGTTAKTGAIVGKEIKAMGGTASSVASYDQIRHELLVPAAQWKRALEIQADSLINPAFDPDEIKRAAENAGAARSIVPPGLGGAGLNRSLAIEFSQNAATSPGLAPALASGSSTREAIQDYFKAHYTAADVLMVVSGDITVSEVLAEAVRLYEKARPGSPKPEAPASPRPATGFRYFEQRGHIRNPQIVFTFRVPASTAAEYPAFEVLASILGMGDASLLAQNLRDRKNLVLGVSTELNSHAGVGFLQVGMEAEAKNIDQSEIAFLTELELLKHHEPDEEAMERAFAMLEQRYWSRLQTVSGRSRAIAFFESQGDWKKINQYLSRDPPGQTSGCRAIRREVPSAGQLHLARISSCGCRNQRPDF